MAIGFLKRFLLVTFVYTIISIIFTYPLIFNLDSIVFGEKGDTFGVVWIMWAHKTLNKSLCDSQFFIPFAGAPFGIVRENFQPVGDVFLFLFGDLFGEIGGYNLLIIVSFVLSALSMYTLSFYFTKHAIASFFAGLIFGFSPYAFAHSIAGHLNFCLNFFIPVFVLMLFHARIKPTIINSLLCGIAFGMLFLTAIYHGFFMFFFTVCFLVFDVLNKEETWNLFLKRWLLIIAGFLIILLAFNWSIFADKGALSSSTTSVYEDILRRPWKDLISHAAKPWDYLLPSLYNPMLGRLLKNITTPLLLGGSPTEHSLYLGIIPLCFAVYVFLKSKRGTMEKFFGITGVTIVLISLPFFIHAYLISFFLSMFRVYARAGIVVIFCVSLLAGFGIAKFLDSLQVKSKKLAYVLVLFLGISLEFLSSPLFINAKEIPPVYQWLAEQPEDFIVIEYPLDKYLHGLPEQYQFYQRIHKKRLFNGTKPGTQGEQIRLSILDSTQPNIISTFQQLNIKYMIIHEELFTKFKGKIPNIKETPNLKFVKKFGTSSVFEIR